MAKLLGSILAWLARTLGVLSLILGALLVGSWLQDQWGQRGRLKAELAANEALAAGLRADIAWIDAAIDGEAAEWRARMSQATQPVRAEMALVDARIERARPLADEALRRFADLERQMRAARQAADAARVEVAAMEGMIRFWDDYLHPEKRIRVEAARAKQRALELAARSWEQAHASVAPKFAASPLDALVDERARLERELRRLADTVSPRQRELMIARSRKEREAATAEQLLASQRERVAKDPVDRLLTAARAQLPVAVAVLAAVLCLPFAVRALLYFVLAPLASRLPPIRVLPDAHAPDIPEPPPSAASLEIDVAPGEELLLQGDFLQSSSQASAKRTQWLLDPRLPFASLASGMVALTRIRPEGPAGTRVVVSSRQDAFGEVGVLDLPAEAALVLQPRALAGVVQSAARPIRITRHWRLGSLHAWLTLQWRYLVFHGPGRLILKGGRGVRAERPPSGQPRLINRSATLGFSANLDYKTTRCETFVAYVRGHEDLFNDLFAGGPGRFVYEVLPSGGRRAGVAGRRLGGVVDVLLKAFGI